MDQVTKTPAQATKPLPQDVQLLMGNQATLPVPQQQADLQQAALQVANPQNTVEHTAQREEPVPQRGFLPRGQNQAAPDIRQDPGNGDTDLSWMSMTQPAATSTPAQVNAQPAAVQATPATGQPAAAAQAAQAAQPEDPIEAMRQRFELLAQQNLQAYGLEPQQVIFPQNPPMAQPAPLQQPLQQQPIQQQTQQQLEQQSWLQAQRQPSVQWQQQQQQPQFQQPITQGPLSYTPQFNVAVSAEDHARILQSHESFNAYIAKVVESAYENGRQAALSVDLPNLTHTLNNSVNRQIAASMFFQENRDLRPYMSTVALVAARLRNERQFPSHEALLAEVGKEVRATLRMNQPAVQAVNNAAQSVQAAQGAQAPRGMFAGAVGSPRTNNTAANGVQSFVGSTLLEDMRNLASGL